MKRFMMILSLSLLVASTAAIGSTSYAQQTIPHREGVSTTINASDIADLLVWANTSKTQLEDGLKQIAQLPTNQRRNALKTLISSVVKTSGVKITELLMRVVLNRALTVDDLLNSNSQSSPEQESLGRRILKDAAQEALLVYVDDSDFLNQAAQSGKSEIPLDLPIAPVGIQLAEYYAGRAMAAPTHQATLEILKFDMIQMYNDLDDSQMRRKYTDVLRHIVEFNKTIENQHPSTPQEYLGLNRRIKAFLDDQVTQAKQVPVVNGTKPVYGGGGATGCRGNSIGMQFSCIRGGTFVMGSPSTEANRSNNETPHRVTVSAFEMQTTDVTQAEWVKVMGSNPSTFKNQNNCPETYTTQASIQMCPNHPVEQVSFGDAQEYIRKVNETLNDGYKYRLPTEAEWEYAARSGSQTAYSFGDNSSVIDQYAWYSGNSNGQTHDVAKLQANGFGLYDMAGNVWQWVQDWYGDYSTNDQVNPLGAQSGSNRVIRGGSWYNDAQFLRSAYRGDYSPDYHYSNVGFRLLRTN